MKKVLIVTDYYFDDRRGGGISSAISNLFHNLDGEMNISFLSFQDAAGKVRPIFFYFTLIKYFYFKKNVVIYLSGIFNFNSNLVPLFMVRFSRNKLILSPRGMLKSTAISNSKKKLLLLKLLGYLLKRSSTIHVTNETEKSESIHFFSKCEHLAILDFPPPRTEVFVERLKNIDSLRLLYIGRIDELKNLYSVLVTIKNLSIFLQNSPLCSKKNIKFTIIGQIADQKYFERCKNLINEIVALNVISIFHLEYVPYHELEQYYLDHDLFISLSKGENFGYTIAESLATAMPVIITPNSPFGELFEIKIGSVVDEKNIDEVLKEILFYLKMTTEDYIILSKSIYDNYNLIFRNTDLICQYKDLFKT
jgi:glycosyltransferase involved in cell wall biosynthesis